MCCTPYFGCPRHAASRGDCKCLAVREIGTSNGISSPRSLAALCTACFLPSCGMGGSLPKGSQLPKKRRSCLPHVERSPNRSNERRSGSQLALSRFKANGQFLGIANGLWEVVPLSSSRLPGSCLSWLQGILQPRHHHLQCVLGLQRLAESADSTNYALVVVQILLLVQQARSARIHRRAQGPMKIIHIGDRDSDAEMTHTGHKGGEGSDSGTGGTAGKRNVVLQWHPFLLFGRVSRRNQPTKKGHPLYPGATGLRHRCRVRRYIEHLGGWSTWQGSQSCSSSSLGWFLGCWRFPRNEYPSTALLKFVW